MVVPWAFMALRWVFMPPTTTAYHETFMALPWGLFMAMSRTLSWHAMEGGDMKTRGNAVKAHDTAMALP